MNQNFYYILNYCDKVKSTNRLLFNHLFQCPDQFFFFWGGGGGGKFM